MNKKTMERIEEMLRGIDREFHKLLSVEKSEGRHIARYMWFSLSIYFEKPQPISRREEKNRYIRSMTEVRNDTTGELIGMAQYDADGKLHGRAYNFRRGTQTIHEDHNYLHGTRHGECTTHFGPWARRVDHYDHGRLTHKEIIEEFERYIVKTTIPWEDASIEKKKTRLPKKKFSEWLSSKQN